MKAHHSLKPVYLCVLLALYSQPTLANPLNPAVVSGQASFATTGNVLTVTNTPGAIINWQGFSVGANEITRFAQQSASSAVLNRVVSSNPSSILGNLQSNGRVFLINPNGIVFGAGATVDVAGLVASTLNLSNADFLAGRNSFTQVPGAANISNAGNLAAQTGGQIFLIAPNVANSGVITAPNGEILLAAGYSVDLVSTTNPNLRVNITAPAGDATNVGQLIASSGSLGLFGTVLRNTGTVSADSAVAQGGKIVFRASQRVEAGGTVSAQGTTGGTIQVLGNEVLITAGANLDASGQQGGGTLLVGGDYRGQNTAVPNATNTYVDYTAQLHANAIQNGSGGKVIVWANDTALVYGNITAKGGVSGGNGGFVETSGKRFLGVTNAADVSAPLGAGGTWLLDPQALTVIGAVAGQPPGTIPLIGTVSPFTAAAAAGSSTISDSVLVAALQGGGNVVLDTGSGGCLVPGTCNITLDASATALGNIVTGLATTLTMNAADSIFINTPVTSVAATVGGTANPLNLVLNHGTGQGAAANLAGSVSLAGGTVDVGIYGIAGAITPGAGILNVTAGNSFAGALTAGTLNVNGGWTQIGGPLVAGNVNAGGGQLDINGATPSTVTNLVVNNSAILGGTGALNVGLAVSPGTMLWTTGGSLAGTGALTVNGTLNAPGVVACPTCLDTLTLSKPLVIGGAAASQANIGSGALNSQVKINVGAGGSITNQPGSTISLNNGWLNDTGLAGALTNNGMLMVGSVVQVATTPVAPGMGGASNIAFINNGGAVYIADSLTLNGPVTFNGGSVIGATLFNGMPVPTTMMPRLTLNGPLTLNAVTQPLMLNHVVLDAFGTTSQGVLGGGLTSVIMMDGGANIYNSGAWTMNSASYSLVPAGVAPVSLSGFYTTPFGSVTVPLGSTATFNPGVSFMNAGTATLSGTFLDSNAVNAGLLSVSAAYAGHLTNTGTLNALAGANFAGDITNNARMNISGATTFQRSLYNAPLATLNLTGATVSVGGDLMNAGIINMNASAVTTCAGCVAGVNATFANKGTLNVIGANTANDFGLGLGGIVSGTAAATDVLTVTSKLGFAGVATLNNVTLATGTAAVPGGNNPLAPAYNLTLQNGAIINNSGLWNFSAADIINAGIGAAPVFNNLPTTGVLAVDAKAGSASFNVPLVNSGSLTVLNGSLGVGALTMSGGTLNAPASLSAGSYQQTAGALSVGNFLASTFTQSGGTLSAGNFDANSFSQTGGAITAANHVWLVAAGAIVQSTSGSVATPILSASASGGINFAGGNQVGSFSAINAVSGNVALNNAAPLSIASVSNPVGNVLVANAGNLNTTGNISALGAINLAATGGDLMQTSGYISNTILSTATGLPTAGVNDVTLSGANVTLQSVQSQRHVVLSSTGNLSLLGLGSGGFIDDTFFVYNLPFAFNYFGTSYSQAYITTNGLIMFGSGTSAYTDSLASLGGLRAISPAWNDWMLNASLGKDIRIGFGANDIKVRFDVVRYGNTTLNAQFETILNSNGAINFNYGAANSTFLNDVTIGISNGAGTAMASLLMSQPNFSMNNLGSTTFTPNGLGGYTETLSAGNVALSPSGAISGSAILGQGIGEVVTAAFGNLAITAGGAIYAPSQISAQSLQFVSSGGALFTGANRFGAIASAANSISGDIVFYNTAVPLTITAMANSGGNIVIDNTGGIVVNGALSSFGTLDMSAHSPITVNNGASISSGGNLTLTAVSSALNATTDMLSIAGAINSTGGSIILGGGSGINFAATSSVTALLGNISAMTPYGGITSQSATFGASGVTFSSFADINLARGIIATQSISLNTGGAITGSAPASLNAPSVQLTAGTGIGSAAAPLQLVTANLNASTLTGGGYLFNTPTAPVTLTHFMTGDASAITYSQSGQDLNLTGIISSAGGNVLIDPPVNLTMSPTASVNSGGGAVSVLASGNILLASINAMNSASGAGGAVSVLTSGGSIGSVLPAGQTNITAGSLTAGAFNGVQLAFVAPSFNITSVNGAVVTTNNSPVVPVVPVAPPVVTPAASQPIVSSLVSNIVSAQTFNVPVNPPVAQVLMQAPLTTPATVAATDSAAATDPNEQKKQAAQDTATAAATPAAAAAPAAPLPVCQ